MERIQLIDVSKGYSKQSGAKLLANWGFWRRDSDPRWFWALDQVNLSIPESGKSIGIIGPNGSGKTTLLRIIAGVTVPTSGTVIVHGCIIPLLEVFAGMQPDFTGRENIYLNGILLGMRRQEIQKKFDSIVAFAGVSEFLDMPLKHYSSGMTMKLGFSVAIHREADIILVDEAWSIGDTAFQAKSLTHLRRLHESGVTLILVSHDLEIMRQLSDEVLWLQNGRTAAMGPTNEIIPLYLKKVSSESPQATSA